MLKKLALGLLVAWAAAGFLHEVNEAVASYDQRQRAVRRFTWRFGAPEPSRLAQCLQQARREIPAGSAVAFTSPDTPRGAAFQRWRWASFFLPDQDVLPAGDPQAAYAISYRMKIEDHRFEPLRRLPCGWLYRVNGP
ncbi:MAG TPA: hypothetical protein VKK31_16100 [Thermoanaerobaculia bacterium]|nr:hypothetical protein [Thermoanaerobaculia bacterium]